MKKEMNKEKKINKKTNHYKKITSKEEYKIELLFKSVDKIIETLIKESKKIKNIEGSRTRASIQLLTLSFMLLLSSIRSSVNKELYEDVRLFLKRSLEPYLGDKPCQRK